MFTISIRGSHSPPGAFRRLFRFGRPLLLVLVLVHLAQALVVPGAGTVLQVLGCSGRDSRTLACTVGDILCTSAGGVGRVGGGVLEVLPSLLGRSVGIGVVRIVKAHFGDESKVMRSFLGLFKFATVERP